MSYIRWPRGSWMRLQSADTLKALMQQRGFSMSRLGRYAGCSKTFVHGLCSGEKRSCTPELGRRIVEGQPTVTVLASRWPPAETP